MLQLKWYWPLVYRNRFPSVAALVETASGLEELSYFQYYKTENPISLYAPDWLLSDIWTHLRPAMETSARGDGGLANFDWYFNPVPIGNPHDFGSFELSYAYTRHVPRTQSSVLPQMLPAQQG